MKRLIILILLFVYLPVFGQYDIFGQYVNPFSVWGSKTKKPSVSFDTDAQALISRMNLARSEQLTLGRQTLISNVFKMLKDSLGVSSLLTVFDCLYFLDNYTVAKDTNIVKLNWVQDAYNLTSYGQITYDSSGGVGGTAKYFGTGFNPTANGTTFTLNNNSFSVFSKTDANTLTYELGAQDANWTALLTRYGGNFYYTNNVTGSHQSVAVANSLGLFTSSRISASLTNALVNGDSIGTSNRTPSGLVNLEVYLLAYNNGGSVGSNSSKKISYARLGRGFSTAEEKKIFNIYMYWWANKNKAEYQ